MKDYKNYRDYKNLLHEAYKHVPHAADGSVSNADLENYMVEHLSEELSESTRRRAVKAFMCDYFAESNRIMNGIYPAYAQWCEEQISKGRAESELTFDNFAEEWAILQGLMQRVQ